MGGIWLPPLYVKTFTHILHCTISNFFLLSVCAKRHTSCIRLPTNVMNKYSNTQTEEASPSRKCIVSSIVSTGTIEKYHRVARVPYCKNEWRYLSSQWIQMYSYISMFCADRAHMAMIIIQCHAVITISIFFLTYLHYLRLLVYTS